jgi:ribonucleotide reductase alpha subunit
LAILKINYDSKEAQELNEQIFETLYYAAVSESCELAKKHGHYESFPGSPASKGILQPDMWGVTPTMYDWNQLKEDVKQYGMMNSLLMAPMPTASTSQILGNNETFEPFTANVYNRRTLSGEFICVNKYLVKDLIAQGIWNEDMKQRVLANNGSVQGIKEIPESIQKLYRTVWELPQKALVDLAVSRGPFIDQSQSLNIFMETPQFNKISSMHFYGWKKGLKTGLYYLRSRPAVDAIKFTVDAGKVSSTNGNMLKEIKNDENLLGKRMEPSNEKSTNGVEKKVRRKLPRMTLDQYNEEDECLNCGS